MTKFKTKVEKKEKSLVSVEVKMDFAEVEKNKKKALEGMSKEAKIDGFRDGKVPEDVLEKQLGTDSVLQEAANITVNEVFAEILKEEKLKMIGYPAISVTKLAEGNDFEFRIEMAVYPDIKLPNYKKAVSGFKREMEEVKEEDYKKVEENILNVYNHQAEHKCADEKCQESHKDEKKEKKEKATKLTDEIVKTLGPFKTVKDFKKQLEGDLKREKEMRAIEKHRSEISEALLKDLKVEIPEMLVNVELDKMIAYMKDEAMRYGMQWEDYLKNLKKDENALREEQRGEAEKRAKLEIVLKEIFREEKLKTDKKVVQQQVDQIKQMHPEADTKNIELYVENIMINEEVMKFLESAGAK